MQFDAELLLLAMAPVFLACIGWEAWHLERARPGAQLYSWLDTLCNAAPALMQQAADKLAWLAIIPVYAFFYDHYRVMTWQASSVSFAVLFVEPLHTHNPLQATFHEWASMAGDFASVRGWRNKLRALFAPPAWAADYHARHVAGSAVASEDSSGKSSVKGHHTAAFQAIRRP